MPSTLQFVDGTTTLDLISTTTTGYRLVQMSPLVPQRSMQRELITPSEGDRLVSAVLGPQRVTITVRIIGSSPDNLDSLLIALVRMLEKAQTWAMRGGDIVLLNFKREGVTNLAQCAIIGVPQMPTPENSESADWLLQSTLDKQLVVTFVLLLEPRAHAPALTTVRSNFSGSNSPTLFTIPTDVAVAGDMAGPFALYLTKTNAGNDWTDVIIIQAADESEMLDFSGTVDANAYNGQASSFVATGTIGGIGSTTSVLAWADRFPTRVLARVKVTNNSPVNLQLARTFKMGGKTSYGPWVVYPNVFGAYLLIDLGEIPALSNYAQLPDFGAATSQYGIAWKTIDTTAVTLSLDVIYTVPYIGMARLTNFTALNGQIVHYDTLQAYRQGPAALIGYGLLSTPEAYLSGASAAFEPILGRGLLKLLEPGVVSRFFVQVQSASLHQLSDTFTLKVDHLPCYSLGLRGNA